MAAAEQKLCDPAGRAGHQPVGQMQDRYDSHGGCCGCQVSVFPHHPCEFGRIQTKSPEVKSAVLAHAVSEKKKKNPAFHVGYIRWH